MMVTWRKKHEESTNQKSFDACLRPTQKLTSAMKQQFKVIRFSSLSKDFQHSKSERHDGFDASIAVRLSSANMVKCGIIPDPADESQMCCDIRSAFSVLNQTTQQPVLVRHGFHGEGNYRQTHCFMKYSDLLDKDVCVDDAVVFEVEFTLSVASVSYGDPISTPLQAAPITATAEYFKNEEMSDVTFLVGPDEVAIPTNKAVLSLRSPVFKTMFYGSLREKSASIKIPDVHVTAFMSLLRYICCMEVIIDKSLIKETLYVADKYDVVDLKQAIGILADNETIPEIIDYCTNTESEKILLLMMTRFVTADFISSPLFLSLLPSSVAWIVSTKGLQVKEMKLWRRCVEWAENQCHKKGISHLAAANLRTEMLPFLHKFCFPAMTTVAFATGSVGSLAKKRFN